MSSSLSKQTCLLGVLGIIFKRRAHNHVYSAILNPRTHKTILECLSISLREGQPSESLVKIMEFKARRGPLHVTQKINGCRRKLEKLSPTEDFSKV